MHEFIPTQACALQVASTTTTTIIIIIIHASSSVAILAQASLAQVTFWSSCIAGAQCAASTFTAAFKCELIPALPPAMDGIGGGARPGGGARDLGGGARPPGGGARPLDDPSTPTRKPPPEPPATPNKRKRDEPEEPVAPPRPRLRRSQRWRAGLLHLGDGGVIWLDGDPAVAPDPVVAPDGGGARRRSPQPFGE